MAIIFTALFTCACSKFSTMSVVCKCIKAWVNFENNIATFTTVATIWATVRYVFFSSKAYVTVATFT